MLSTDVAVVGGGPAGAAAATLLARAGRRVVIVDKAVFPRDKCCGDGLTTGALRRLEALGLDPGAVASWEVIDACWVRSPSGRTVAFPFPSGAGMFGAVVRRRDLDQALLQLARSAGATIREGCAFRGAQHRTGDVLLDVEVGEPIAARYVVAADGMWSAVRKAVSPGPDQPAYRGEWHALRQYFRTTAEPARRLWVWFEPELLPGYAWSFPLSGNLVNVGFGIRRRPGESARPMAEIWRQLLQLPHIAEVLGPDACPQERHRSWPIPTRVTATSQTAAGGRVLFVGDAARAGDPMTGEGISQALETGMLAAAAIISAGPESPGRAAEVYRRALRRELALDHRLAAALSLVLGFNAGARAAVRLAGATNWTREQFARWLFEDYPRALLATPGRWRRGMFSAPGAFQA